MTLEYVEPTPAQIKMWEDTRAALVWHAPAFTHLFYNMMTKNNGKHFALFTKDPAVPIAATDGSNILINPDTFFQFSLSERVFICCHEISHGMFGHMELMHKLKAAGKVCYPDGKELGYDHMTMNKAMDYVINDMLVDGKLGTMPSVGMWDTTIATHMDSVLTAYRRIYDPNQQGGKGGKAGQDGFDTHMDPGTTTGQDPGTATANRSDVEWKTAIAGAIATAKAQGKLPGSLERLLGKELEAKVDWTDKVIGWFNRKPGGGTYNWRKVDRRFITRNIVAPARSGFGCGVLVVGIDTSGSVGQHELDVFFGEMSGIIADINPAMMYVMWCDAHVHRVDEVYDAMDLAHLRTQKAPGGGGTSFIPVFEMVDEMGIEPDALIYLTDGMGTHIKKAPNYPVMWGNIYPSSTYPFGEVIDVPVK